MKIMLGDFNAKVGWKDIFKPTTGNNSLHEISDDNGVKSSKLCHIQKFDCQKYNAAHCNIHKFTWTSPNGKTHNQIDILIDRRRHSSIPDVRTFRATDCDTDHYLVVAKVRERLAVSKQTMHRFHMETFGLKKN
jgi:hypothetical protein